MQPYRSLTTHYLRRVSYLFRRHPYRTALVACLAVGLIFVFPIYAALAAYNRIYSPAAAPSRTVAIVFGAGVNHDGTPTPYLVSRLLAAQKLYAAKKVKVFLLSGDNSTKHYNEPIAMKRFLVAHGVPENKIVLDYAGYDTYDTCYRARYLFGVTQAVLVSHGYHLPRAILTCSNLGIRSIGVTADRPEQQYSKMYLVRELLSLNKAWVQMLLRPKPQVLGPLEPGIRRALQA